MKKEEFRALIEERGRLYSTLIKWSIRENEELLIRKKILEIDKLLNIKIPDDSTNYWFSSYNIIENLFTIGLDNIKQILESYFSDKGNVKVIVDYRLSGDEMVTLSGEYLLVITPRAKYNLGSIRYNEALRILYNPNFTQLKRSYISHINKNEGTWETLLKKYPDLIDYLWQKFFELKNQNKKEKISIISDMIKKNNYEQTLLKSPELRDIRITELMQEKNTLDDELSKLTNSLEEIEI